MRFVMPLVVALFATTALSQTTGGQRGLARNGLEATIAQLSADPAPQEFEIGMLLTLRAVEKTLQVRYDYGLGQRLTGLPVLRLGTGGMTNPAPKPSGPETLTGIIDGFVTDMAQARATLDDAQTKGIEPFEMALSDIWFDINSNGKREKSEGAIPLLGPTILGRRAYPDFTESDAGKRPLIIRFDETDHAWLLAYTHMLSGFGNLIMAFDPEPVLRDLAGKRATLTDAPRIPNYYDPQAIKAEIAILEVEEKQIQDQRNSLNNQVEALTKVIRTLQDAQRETNDTTPKADLTAQLAPKQEGLKLLGSKRRQLRQKSRLIRREIAVAKEKLTLSVDPNPSEHEHEQARVAVNAVYVILKALEQNPDPARIRAARDHMQSMIAQNRVFWARLAEETDNDREWIPNAAQQSALPLTIPPGLAESWQNILEDVEAVLEGKLLIPHWLLPYGYGISLPAYVNDPAPVALAGWVLGVDLYPYAARGPRLTSQSWEAFQRLTLGNAGRFALFLN
ncbi:MAG: hypothetical protein ACI8R4_001396 [Paracoccaceae bacterium]|jgi:hypothetical protein